MIIRRRQNGRYAALPNAIWEDSRISVEAKGVLGYLLSRPHNWQVRLTHVGKQLGVGKDRLQRIFRELIGAGYITREHTRNDGGAFGGIEYVVRDEAGAEPDPQSVPNTPDADDEDDIPSGVASLPQPEKPAPAKPQPENTAADKRKNIITTDLTKPLSPTRSEPSGDAAGHPRELGRALCTDRIARRERPEVIQNRIAQRLGPEGWVILSGLSASKLDQITAMERRGTLDDAALSRAVVEACQAQPPPSELPTTARRA